MKFLPQLVGQDGCRRQIFPKIFTFLGLISFYKCKDIIPAKVDSSLNDTFMEEYGISIYKNLTDMFGLPRYESGQAGAPVVGSWLRTGSTRAV